MQNTAVYAPITFEDIVMVMITCDIVSPIIISVLIMVIGLSGVQFGL